jgi:TonB family protein
LGGVGTRGRAGGTGNFKDGTALAGGNVGSGDIVAMVDEETVIEGGLDRDAIAEVIRRNLGQIRYCYERQLSSNPELYGKVLVKFTIGANGGVAEQRVDNSTLKSAMVEGCIMRRMASWQFPLPKGGTQVHVSYPFLFKAN